MRELNSWQVILFLADNLNVGISECRYSLLFKIPGENLLSEQSDSGIFFLDSYKLFTEDDEESCLIRTPPHQLQHPAAGGDPAHALLLLPCCPAAALLLLHSCRLALAAQLPPCSCCPAAALLQQPSLLPSCWLVPATVLLYTRSYLLISPLR